VALPFLVAGVLPFPAAAATRPITFEGYLGLSGLFGNASDSSTVNLRWRDAQGNLKIEGQTMSNVGGGWFFDTDVVLEPGDRLRAADGNSVRVFVVPELTAVANRVKNVFKGTAPVGTRIDLECTFPGEPVPDIACDRQRLRVNEFGRFWHYPGWNMSGGDGAEFRWRSDEGDRIYFGVQASQLVITLGRARVDGLGRQNATALVTLKDGATHDVLGSLSRDVGLDQRFGGPLRDASGDPVIVEPGQRIVSNISSDAAFTVPQIQATGDADTETVSGWCEDTGRSASEVWIRLYRSGHRRGFAITGTEPDGTFSQNMTEVFFPDSSVVKHGDRLQISCVQKNRDLVDAWFTVP
jgi:hypothetical protein